MKGPMVKTKMHNLFEEHTTFMNNVDKYLDMESLRSKLLAESINNSLCDRVSMAGLRVLGKVNREEALVEKRLELLETLKETYTKDSSSLNEWVKRRYEYYKEMYKGEMP